jgi:hypothetical protein
VAGDLERFEEFCEQVRNLATRSEIELNEVPAPQRLAPYSFALSADVAVGGDDVGTGRFVILHDPSGQEAWQGNFRCVTFVRSAIEVELQSDPMLAEVAWSWVLESLEKAEAKFSLPSGTVTRVASASFGQLSESEDSSEIEIRASWTPDSSAPLRRQVDGWLKLLESVTGLTPIADGVSALRSRR